MKAEEHGKITKEKLAAIVKDREKIIKQQQTVIK